MSQATLVLGGGLTLAAAFVYLVVGLRLRRRSTRGAARRASQAFALWWVALAGSTLTTAIQQGAGALAVADLATYTTLTIVNFLFICVGLASLLYYLLYLFTGRDDLLVPLALAYLVYFATLLYVITAADPVGVEIGRWNVSLVFAEPLSGPVPTVLLLLLVVPQILGAAAYMSLVAVVESPTRRYRVALVSGSIIVWFSTTLIGVLLGLAGTDLWQVGSRLLGLAAAMTVLYAYYPPVWLREMVGIGSLEEEVARPSRRHAP